MCFAEESMKRIRGCWSVNILPGFLGCRASFVILGVGRAYDDRVLSEVGSLATVYDGQCLERQ